MIKALEAEKGKEKEALVASRRIPEQDNAKGKTKNGPVRPSN